MPCYDYHPEFVGDGSFALVVNIFGSNLTFKFIGIPGEYVFPPLHTSDTNPNAYYIITKGLYVGIFTSWWVRNVIK